MSKFYRNAGRGLLGTVLAICLGSGCATPKGETAEDKQSHVRDMKDKTVAELVEAKPEVEQRIKAAAGYAVFSNINIKIFAVGSGNGYGVAVDNKTGEETFMRMAEVGMGLGMGMKNIRTVFIFPQRAKFDQFVEKGWTFGAEASASAKDQEEGTSAQTEVSFDTDIEVFQLTESGLMASAMVSGTKYWKDEDLH